MHRDGAAGDRLDSSHFKPRSGGDGKRIDGPSGYGTGTREDASIVTRLSSVSPMSLKFSFCIHDSSEVAARHQKSEAKPRLDTRNSRPIQST